MFGDNIRNLRELKGLGVNELSRLSGVNASYISSLERNEKQNPTVTTLKKLADALDVSIDELIKEESTKYKNKEASSIEEKTYSYPTNEFNSAESAMKFILKQPSIMGFGGFDINKMNDEDIINFANELLNQLKLLSYKYKK